MLEAAALLHYLKEKWLNSWELQFNFLKKHTFFLYEKNPKPNQNWNNKRQKQNQNENQNQNLKLKTQNPKPNTKNKQKNYWMLPGKDQPQMELLQHSLSFLALSVVIMNYYYEY